MRTLRNRIWYLIDALYWDKTVQPFFSCFGIRYSINAIEKTSGVSRHADSWLFLKELLDYTLYNNPSYYCILIGSCLWSIRGQTHDWRHHYRVFASAVLKWRKVLRIRIIFYVTRQKLRYKKVLPRHRTGSRSQKAKDKAVSFRKWYRNNFLAASVGSRASLNHAQTWSW